MKKKLWKFFENIPNLDCNGHCFPPKPKVVFEHSSLWLFHPSQYEVDDGPTENLEIGCVSVGDSLDRIPFLSSKKDAYGDPEDAGFSYDWTNLKKNLSLTTFFINDPKNYVNQEFKCITREGFESMYAVKIKNSAQETAWSAWTSWNSCKDFGQIVTRERTRKAPYRKEVQKKHCKCTDLTTSPKPRLNKCFHFSLLHSVKICRVVSDLYCLEKQELASPLLEINCWGIHICLRSVMTSKNPRLLK